MHHPEVRNKPVAVGGDVEQRHGIILVKNQLAKKLIQNGYPDGTIAPLAIWWGESMVYPIDKIVDIRPCASLKAGGAGIRYTCTTQGHEKYIWFEEFRWFVEAKGLN